MSRTIPLTSLTRLFEPIPECDRIFVCKKNGLFPYKNGWIPLSELMFIVYPINPKRLSEINHGTHTDIFVFGRCEFDGPVLDVQTFIKTMRDAARKDENICCKTCNLPVEIVDNDPRIEYEVPPDSPLKHLTGLSNDFYEKSKIPPEIDEYISTKIIQLPDRNSKKVLYFGHIVGLYIFAEIDELAKVVIVRHYTGFDNTRHETLHMFMETHAGDIKSYVELNDGAMLINNRLVIGCHNFNDFIRQVFDFDHVKNIKIVQTSEIGNTSENIEKKNKPKLGFDDDDPGFLTTGNEDFIAAMMDNLRDNFGNAQLF